eukprot:240325_1
MSLKGWGIECATNARHTEKTSQVEGGKESQQDTRTSVRREKVGEKERTREGEVRVQKRSGGLGQQVFTNFLKEMRWILRNELCDYEAAITCGSFFSPAYTSFTDYSWCYSKKPRRLILFKN